MLLIRDYPSIERPRERLLQVGVEGLANAELLAILLRSGTKEVPVLQLAHTILREFETLHELKGATLEELMAIKGIGETKAMQLAVAIELGRRIHQAQFQERFTVRSPEDAANYIMEELRFLPQEHFVVLYLNTKNQILLKKTLFIGSLNASIVHPREVVRPRGA